ncbi:nucleolar protein 8 isoform X2 [Gasterosteus aculeatus]
MRRLYVGGLSHTVTQNDLKERFGRFGDVEDVEVRTRMDDEGVPYKTFSYININISDGDLKKCMTLLNKSKWKGGTLQIETAKESFLQRLAEERQTAAEQKGLRQPKAEDQKQKVLDSLSKAGVENFTMKAAVPGTEVPGHKDWVVSKFGRVLPVLQLKAQKGSRARTLKYDPSKYSHNIRKLDRAGGADLPTPVTPVTQLTWEVQGGDDDISKKRRGEFPLYEPPRRKKGRADAGSARDAEGAARAKPTVGSAPRAEAPRLANGREAATDPGPARREWPRFAGADSDDEIRRLVAPQDTSHDALRQEEDDDGDKLEVVGLDYLVKSGRKGGPDHKDENDYDSADTDELFASRKAALPPPQERPTPRAAAGNAGNRKRKLMKKKKKSGGGEEEEEEEEDDSSEEEVFSRKPPAECSSQNQSKKMRVLPVVNPPSSESDGGEEEEEEEEEPSDCSDSDYEAMFSNVTHLSISLADLQKLAEESPQTPETRETTAPSVLPPAHKKGILPEEILASLMRDDPRKDKLKERIKAPPLPAFKGTRALSGGEERRPKEEGGGSVKKQKLVEEPPPMNHKATGSTINGRDLAESESSEEEEEEAACEVVKNIAEAGSSSSSEEEEEKRKKKHLTAQPEAAAASSSSSSSSSEEGQENAVKAAKPPAAPDSESSSEEEEEEEEKKQAPPLRLPLGAKEEEERQRKANERRLAAVQQRQKEADEHKQLIQGALSNLDIPKAAAGKHIVFGSDDEDERQTTPKKTVSRDGRSEGEATVGDEETARGKMRPKPSVPQLFAGDEEEGDEEEDGSRFDIKPQFEGRVGQKLMELQSRFGRDERFRMDSRFLDEEEEEESEKKKSGTEEEEALDEEKKKNLSILQDVLGGSRPAGGAKTAAKPKAFRDVSALHYDPSREEHAAFETKTDNAKKDSKAARRKKREEAQKLPEVSKEIYYDVSGDLKAVFGQAKAAVAAEEDDVVPAAEDEETNWDREEEAEGGGGEDEEPALQSSLLAADPAAESEEASGFKFSFFEDDAQTGSGETEYKVESIQAPKVSWQQDLRFPDSSSDDDDEEEQPEEEEQEQPDVTAKTTKVEIPSKAQLFFFYCDDSRLTEGPRSFCRPSHLEEQREQWEERRTELREEYRKKHKDARRKLRSSLKS